MLLSLKSFEELDIFSPYLIGFFFHCKTLKSTKLTERLFVFKSFKIKVEALNLIVEFVVSS